MTALKLALVKRRIKDIHTEKARGYHKNSLMRLTWRIWSERVDQKSELKLLPQTAHAVLHHRFVYLNDPVCVVRSGSPCTQRFGCNHIMMVCSAPATL